MLLRLVLCFSIAPSVLFAQRDTTVAVARTAADTAIILSSATGANSSRFVVHHSSGVHLLSPALERRGDTLSVATPATLVFEREQLNVELYALVGDLRVQTRQAPYDCILEGPVLRFVRLAPTDRLRFVPDPRTRTNCYRVQDGR